MLTKLKKSLARQIAALDYVLRVVIPVILKTGRRPVVFYRGAGLGDIICTIPAVNELKKRHPGATFIYNCRAGFSAIPRLAGLAGQVTSLGPMSSVNHWYGFLLGGYYEFNNGDPMLDRPILADFCNQFGVTAPAGYPVLPVSEAMRGRAKKILSQKKVGTEFLITIHPGPSHAVKEWPREKWGLLVAKMRDHGFTNIVQLGISQYLENKAAAFAAVSGVVSFVDELTLEDSIAIVSSASLHIGIDSGLLHVAAATGVPSVGLFGVTLPQRIFPKISNQHGIVTSVECRGCGHYNAATPYTDDCPYHIRCMREISVDEVLNACLARLRAAK
jgi:ADP-heptose:LPS heptosyltransferase